MNARETDGPVRTMVHSCYWDHNDNCAKTTLRVLAELSGLTLSPQVLDAAVGMHGAGGYRAQCGLVEGSLMFLGVQGKSRGKSDDDVAAVCRLYAEEFTRNFGSLRCFDLRPGGFSHEDRPHLCESLTVKAICFSWRFFEQHSV